MKIQPLSDGSAIGHLTPDFLLGISREIKRLELRIAELDETVKNK